MSTTRLDQSQLMGIDLEAFAWTIGRKANWLSMLDFESKPWPASGHNGIKTISSLRIKPTQIKAWPSYGEGNVSKNIVWASEFSNDRTSFHFCQLINFSFSLPSSFSFLYYSLAPVVDFFPREFWGLNIICRIPLFSKRIHLFGVIVVKIIAPCPSNKKNIYIWRQFGGNRKMALSLPGKGEYVAG